MCMYVTSKLHSHKYTNMYRMWYQFRGSPAVTMGEFISLNRDRYQSSHYHKPKKKNQNYSIDRYSAIRSELNLKKETVLSTRKTALISHIVDNYGNVANLAV